MGRWPSGTVPSPSSSWDAPGADGARPGVVAPGLLGNRVRLALDPTGVPDLRRPRDGHHEGAVRVDVAEEAPARPQGVADDPEDLREHLVGRRRQEDRRDARVQFELRCGGAELVLDAVLLGDVDEDALLRHRHAVARP